MPAAGMPNRPMPKSLVDLLKVLEKLPVPNSKVLIRPENKLLVPPPILTDLVQEIKLLVPILKVPNPKVVRPENKKQLVPTLTDLVQEIELLIPISKQQVPNSKVLIRKKNKKLMMPILTDLLQDLKLLRTTLKKVPNSKVLTPENKLIMPPILTDLLQEIKLLIPILKCMHATV